MSSADVPDTHTEREIDSSTCAEAVDATSTDVAILDDPKLSRKREREASLEPTSNVQDSTSTRETRSPKKNRASAALGATEEEEDNSSRSLSRSPPMGGSPPHDSTVRQISQGVGDITWRNNQMNATAADAVGPVESPDKEIVVDAPQHDAQNASEMVTSATTTSSVLWSTTNEEDGDANMPPVDSSGEVPSYNAAANDGADENSSLKRKMADRAVSQGPPLSAVEPLKRPRDDPDKDDNPRFTKRPTPPPESEAESSKTAAAAAVTPAAAPKFGGFMAYASASSPYAAVKGKNLFGGGSNKPATPSKPFTTQFESSSKTSFSGFAAPIGDSSTPKSQDGVAPKKTGFESFMGTASPFATSRSKSPTSLAKRSKSPTRRNANSSSSSLNAFSGYAGGGASGYASPVPKRARAGSPENASKTSSRSSSESARPAGSVFGKAASEEDGDEGGSAKTGSFGDKLRAQKDDGEEDMSEEDADKPAFLEQEAHTGEEDEITLHQVRGKLFYLEDSQWKERGTGTLRLNVRREDRGGARLVMRKEAVYTLLLNATLFVGMKAFIAQDPRYVRFSVITGATATHYNLRLPTAKAATELLDEINSNIPL